MSKFKLGYSTVSCDGEAKTIAAINDLHIYDVPVTKEDCMNHVAKRMWKGLDTLKKSICGAGKQAHDSLVQVLCQAAQDACPGHIRYEVWHHDLPEPLSVSQQEPQASAVP